MSKLVEAFVWVIVILVLFAAILGVLKLVAFLWAL